MMVLGMNATLWLALTVDDYAGICCVSTYLRYLWSGVLNVMHFLACVMASRAVDCASLRDLNSIIYQSEAM